MAEGKGENTIPYKEVKVTFSSPYGSCSYISWWCYALCLWCLCFYHYRYLGGEY
ncbi:hypothetical protein [Cyanobacterium sp. Dongsha4]|uniref:hypothetical protein n=1 Tax=Cyanobacterium sp. DS4 TaxID=2878255 RepID=UPI002E800A5C|nr:hypothetical protein [Cyanobacterium sp. Dongsha4]WVL00454.1 hypothetical protein Dongsha4_17680 [Cyanobacterium sp. Dongsha4]